MSWNDDEGLRSTAPIFANQPRRPAAPNEALGRGDEPAMWCRQEAISTLERLMRETEAGPGGRALFLGGEMGAGKSQLAEWCAWRAQGEDLDFIVARSTCEPFQVGMMLFPVRELIRRLVEGGDPVQFVRHTYGENSIEYATAVRAFADQTDPADQHEYVAATFANIVSAVARETDRPVLVFIDDLERIDTGSVDSLTVLLSRIGDARIFVLGAFQSDLVAADRQHHMKSIVERARRGAHSCELLEVVPFTASEIPEVVRNYLGGTTELPQRFMRRLYQETEGNPLYIRELLRTLRVVDSSGRNPPLHQRPDGTWVCDDPLELWDVPRTIEDVVATRLYPLTTAQRDVLDEAAVVAVVGRTFRYETLLQVSGLNETDLLETLEQLMALDLLQEASRDDNAIQFTHSTIREVVYSQLTGIRKARLHAQVADVCASQQDLFENQEWEVAMGSHLMAARRYDAAAPHLLVAGERALAQQAATEAASYFRNCVEALEKSNSPDPRKLADVRLLLGEALKMASQLESALRELEAVAETNDSLAAQRWALAHIGDIYKFRDQIPEAEGRYHDCERAAELAGDEALLAEVAADLAELHMREAERLAGSEPEVAERHRDAYKQYLDRETEHVDHVDNATAKARSLRNRAKYARAQGNTDLAIDLYEQSLQFVHSGVASHQFLVPYAKALRLVGRERESKAIVESVLEWSLQIGSTRSEGIARQYLGLLLMEEALVDSAHPTALLTRARHEMQLALTLHEEANFKQGYRETLVDLIELELHSQAWRAANDYLRQAVRVGALGKLTTHSAETSILAIAAQLKANGETLRAERLLRAAEGAKWETELE